jgi:NADPH:quinone reductase-like Zn-dependent oxidoreductase
MKVVRIHEFGGPNVLAIEDAPMPEPQAGEVLVRVHAASINPVDYKMRSGHYGKAPAEQLNLGRDVAGTIERVGSDVSDFQPGDHVIAMLPRDRGGYAEYVAIDAALVARKPSNLDDTEAAAIPLAAITAWQGLFDHGNLAAGQHVLIHGGAGGVGHFAVQLAHAAGARVSTTVGTDDIDFARELGADQVIDYERERFEDQVHDVDLVLDLVAGETQARSWNVLREGGTLVSTLSEPSQRDAKEHHARGESYLAQPNARELQQIAKWIEEGKVRPVVSETVPFDEVARAQERLEEDHVRGKVVLRIAS